MSAEGEIRSTCPYCGVGCGVLLRADGRGGLEVRGDPEHPANYGRLCSKGSALGETLGLDGRLLAPRIDGVEAVWDDALELVADKFSAAIEEHGPDSVAFYVSGQLLTEDYYVANKLMKGFIGSANIDTNSRLCMASTVAGHKRAFGTDTVPGTYEDLEEADLVVLVGSNLAWCHPVLHQRLLAARARRGTRIVVVDPRRTASCDAADLHLALEPGTDVALFNHLLAAIADAGLIAPDRAGAVNGLDEALAAARATDVSATGLSGEHLAQFCAMWTGTERVVTVFSQGVNQSTSGSDKVNAILNCHLATHRIGRIGMGPFSVTGQPNAMGGREVGGLANMLACHLDLENADHRMVVGSFWNAASAIPNAPGLKAVDMFKAVGDGRIKALWVIHTNPAVSMPDADAVRDAIDGCPFVVVSDITAETDTARLADVVLPASGWAEKSGTVTNTDRTISRQRSVLPSPGLARPDWQILAQVAQRMGWVAAFDWQSPAEIFREYAALSAASAQFGRDFDISGLQGLDEAEYDALSPTRWPVTREGGRERFFADGRYYHPDGKARMLSVSQRGPAARTGPKYPFRLNTGRIRDQWHTMTRTARAPRLSAHLAEPFLDIHPEDAAQLGLAPAALVRVRSPQGQAIFRARQTNTVARGQVFAPIHWTGETAPAARVDAVIPSAHDPISGQPESKAAVVAVEPFEAMWYGFAVSAEPLAPTCEYWARSRTDAGWRVELAGLTAPEDWEHYARALFGLDDVETQMVSDPARGATRIAFHRDGVLLAALFLSDEPVIAMRDYVASLPGTAAPAVLSGRRPGDQPDPGPILCACLSVGINTILSAIEDQNLMSVEAIGAALGAGTNCGSCRPEIAELIGRSTRKIAAE
ncbi:nitrate reductase [Pontivivens insulae]|uniref:Nitrate reductase n=1 Tax=Pontivivens insulae TaxID=1639689 RepID=A0A2R8AFC0_9RHOB|nr:nitrate reductase [Pontivivens insulae]RED12188.1 assimilatory nitrate reductase (NADH) alpha subunit apoprotein [Pontivivens insulae]SPF30944.1 Nitrate reductase [Pontivivens insulae]